MRRVALYLVGIKGFCVLNSAIKRNKALISDVVGGRDVGIDCDYYEEIKTLCDLHYIPHHDRLSLKFSAENYDGYMLAIGWRWMLPAKESLIIIHDSLLPKYRGFSPLVNYLINGETEIGATALFATENYDAGKLISQASQKISYPIKIFDAIALMSTIYIQLANDLLDRIQSQNYIESIPQKEELATYSLWRDDEDYWIKWTKPAEEIARFTDAVGLPYAGARCLLNGEVAILHSAMAIADLAIADRESSIGKVLFIENGIPVVVCTKGLLKICKLTTVNGTNLLPLAKFRSRFLSRLGIITFPSIAPPTPVTKTNMSSM